MGLFDGTALERPVLCDRCRKDVKDCCCPPPDVAPDQQQLKLRIEKRRNGKLVTVIDGFSCSKQQIQELLTVMKSTCGAGGTLTESTIELQGDHLVTAQKLLVSKGYRLRR